MLHDQFRAYRETLRSDQRLLLERFQIIDMARKVVGVGSVGTRAFIVLLQGRDQQDPLFLQVKEATKSVLEDHLPASTHAEPGERVVHGQRLMQAASDIYLGWTKGSEADRHMYWRQLRDMKVSAEVETMGPRVLLEYAEFCGRALARAHARSGDPVAIAAYLGSKDAFDRSIADFSTRYADQNERDYQGLPGGDQIRSPAGGRRRRLASKFGRRIRRPAGRVAATVTASLREVTPNLRYTALTCELTVFRDTNSRSAISRIDRCVCRYGSSRSSARGERRGAGRRSRLVPHSSLLRSAATSSTSVPERGPVHHDVVDLVEQVANRAGVTDRQVEVAELHPHPNGEIGHDVGQHRPAPHRLRQLTVHLDEVASMQRQSSRTGEREPTRGIVVHPVLIDDLERIPDVLGGLRPMPSIHRQHREFRLAVDERIVVPHLGGQFRRLGECDGSLLVVSGQQPGLAQHAQRRVAPRAPCRFLPPSRTVPSASICSGPDAHIAARNIARADSNDAEPSEGT